MPHSPDGTYYKTAGAADAPAVVFIHGLGLCQQVWDGVLPALSQYRLITYDLYGHGRSSPAGETATLGVYAQQLSNLLDHLQINRADVVGFSIGGMINRRFAMDFPQKLSRLVILNSPHNRGTDAQEQVEARTQQVRNDGPMATMEAALERWLTPDFLRENAGTAQTLRNWRAQADGESYAQAAWVLAHGVRELIAPNPRITAPTLVMTCENDVGSTPKMSHDIAQEIAGAKLKIVPDLRHLGLIEQPDLFTGAMLEFLEG